MNKETAIALYRLSEGQRFTLTPGMPESSAYTAERVTTDMGFTRVVYSISTGIRAEFTKASLTTVYI